MFTLHREITSQHLSHFLQVPGLQQSSVFPPQKTICPLVTSLTSGHILCGLCAVWFARASGEKTPFSSSVWSVIQTLQCQTPVIPQVLSNISEIVNKIQIYCVLPLLTQTSVFNDLKMRLRPVRLVRTSICIQGQRTGVMRCTQSSPVGDSGIDGPSQGFLFLSRTHNSCDQVILAEICILGFSRESSV